jgi:aspartyl-tRNA(Asn)/glutamyl-tRNA(Gln) amidotransferase subunit C
MTKLDRATIQKIADLSMIEISDSEADLYATQISSILEYVDILKEVEDVDVEFKSQVNLRNVMREDEIKPSLEQSEAIGQGENSGGYIVVPSVI